MPDNAVVEIAYHGLPRTWKDFLLMQGFDEQQGNISTLLEISQRIETMEEWSETKKAATGKRDRSVSEKSDKSSNKKQKSEYYCEYHGPNKTHSTKDCTTCKSILQSARKSRDDKHGSDKTSASSNAGSDYARRVTFKKPWKNPAKDESMQAMFATAFKDMAATYLQGKQKKKDKNVPTEEFNNLNLEEDSSSSDSDSSSSDKEWYTHGTRRNNLCLELHHLHGPVKKKPKCTHKTTEIVAIIYLNTKQTQTRALRVLVDTGASASVIIGEHCTKLKMKSSPTTTWNTKAGTFTTTRKARLRFVLPEFNPTKEISWACHVDDNATARTSQYDLILGRDLLEALGLIINFHDQTMMWEEATIPMKDYGSLPTRYVTGSRWLLRWNIYHWRGEQSYHANDANTRR